LPHNLGFEISGTGATTGVDGAVVGAFGRGRSCSTEIVAFACDFRLSVFGFGSFGFSLLCFSAEILGVGKLWLGR